jgi:predicted negative regulator of RcsB-dependent stress response
VRAWAALIIFSLTPAALAADWSYPPVRPDLWALMQAAIKRHDFQSVLKFSLKAETKTGVRPMENVEAQLMTAEAFAEAGLTDGARRIWIDVARRFPGTNQANLALLRLSRAQATGRHPDDDLQILVNEGRQNDAPGEAGAMVAYFTALQNMKNGHDAWISPAAAKIDSESYWGRKFRFLKALDKVRAGSVDDALLELRELSADAHLEPSLKHDVDWQIARLALDKGEYDAAEAIYAGFRNYDRDLGRAMLERAWIRFYRKDYSTALGMLYSLRAPVFAPSRSPEQYLLSMLIYRDLCHYDSVQSVARDFENKFSGAFEALKNRELSRIPELMNMVLVRADRLPTADLIHSVREEKRKMQGLSGLKDSLKKYAVAYDRRENEIRARFEHGLREQLQSAATKLIEAREQVRLLDYVAGIEKLGVDRTPAGRDYKAEKENPLSFQKLYWPFIGEYWWGETANFRVLVSNRCQEGK